MNPERSEEQVKLTESEVAEALRGDRSCILVVNVGSSSLKFGLFTMVEPFTRLVSGRIENIGRTNAQWTATIGGGRPEVRPIDATDDLAALKALDAWIEEHVGKTAVAAVGHRVVHGGMHHYRPEKASKEVIDELRQIITLDPDHLPAELEVIEALSRLHPALPQILCYDTAFHHDLPRIAQILPVPRRFEAMGVRRYGFHGLSYTYLLEELARVAGQEAARGRVILAHLGSGASLAAVRDGHCVDTSMGFTPAAGLVMGTRTGDLDPGLTRFMMRSEGLTPERFDHMVNSESGLLGVSETSSDLRELLSKESDDSRAAEAVALFCYQVKKWIGAFAAANGGLDTLVFAGGIGENSHEARRRICEGMAFLGISLDEERNAAGGPLISIESAPAKVWVIPTDEELMIAKEVSRFISS